MIRHLYLCIAFLGASFFANICFSTEQPLAVRNMMPVSQIFGLPRPMGADFSEQYNEALIRFEITNNFSGASNDAGFVFLDGETYWLGLSGRFFVGEDKRYELGAEIPYIVHGPGHLDGFVEGFHDFFGFPDGKRKMVPKNQLEYRIALDGKDYLNFNTRKSHIGDSSVWFGYQVFSEALSALALRAMIKFPTGNLSDLSGSGAPDLSIWAEYENLKLFQDWSVKVTAGGGVVFLGKSDIFRLQQNSVVGVFHVGIQRPLGRHVTFIAQLDGHTRLIQAPFVQIGGSTLQGTLGGRVRLAKRYWVDFGVVENLASNSAPDFTVQVAIGTRF